MSKKIGPLVSVVLVNFNGKKFLNNCMSSIFKNDYENYEVVVVDNNSSDKSIDLAEKKFGGRKNLKILQNINFTFLKSKLNSSKTIVDKIYDFKI